MARRNYPALIHKDEDTVYGISFPDVPGCISAGETLEECLIAGEQALGFHLEGLAEDKQTIPEPSALSDVRASVRKGKDDTLFAVQLVPANVAGEPRRQET